MLTCFGQWTIFLL